MTESVYGPGERGPDLHVHREHADAWLVLEGTLSFELRDRITFEAPAGTLVVVPRNVAHGFWNERDEAARFLNIHAPACGFGDYMRGTFPISTSTTRRPTAASIRARCSCAASSGRAARPCHPQPASLSSSGRGTRSCRPRWRGATRRPSWSPPSRTRAGSARSRAPSSHRTSCAAPSPPCGG